MKPTKIIGGPLHGREIALQRTSTYLIFPRMVLTKASYWISEQSLEEVMKPPAIDELRYKWTRLSDGDWVLVYCEYRPGRDKEFQTN